MVQVMEQICIRLSFITISLLIFNFILLWCSVKIYGDFWPRGNQIYICLSLKPLETICCELKYNSQSFAAAAKSLQSCLILCDLIDGSPPGSPFPGILQARTLEWVAISFSNAWKWKVKLKSLSRVWLFETPWTVGCHCLLPFPSV